jgi:hypothetical protein
MKHINSFCGKMQFLTIKVCDIQIEEKSNIGYVFNII